MMNIIHNHNHNQQQDEGNKTVFQLNTEAIEGLQQRRYSDAISMLQDAVSWMRDLAHDPTRHGFELFPLNGYGSQAENDVIEDIKIMSVPASNRPTRTNTGVEDTLFELFDMGFVTVFLDYQGTMGQRLTTCFLLYNLGLCYHHREVSNGTMNRDNLSMALRYYGRALRFIDGALGDGRYEDVTILLLAIFNNMGYLYTYFGQHHFTRHCILWIRNLLSMPQARYLGLSRQDMAFFYENYELMLVHNNINFYNSFEKAAAA